MPLNLNSQFMLYWACILACCTKRFLLMNSDGRTAVFYHTFAFTITGNQFHSAVSCECWTSIKQVCTLVTVQIPHRVVMLSLTIPNLYLWVWLLPSKAYCMNIRKPVKDWSCRTNCLRTGHTQDTMHGWFCICDCNFFLYSLLLYSLIMICICTL